MSDLKPLGGLYARPGPDRHTRVAYGPDEDREDVVEVYGPAEWLKSRPMVGCKLTPAAARRLAVQLLNAAENVASRPAPTPERHA